MYIKVSTFLCRTCQSKCTFVHWTPFSNKKHPVVCSRVSASTSSSSGTKQTSFDAKVKLVNILNLCKLFFFCCCQPLVMLSWCQIICNVCNVNTAGIYFLTYAQVSHYCSHCPQLCCLRVHSEQLNPSLFQPPKRPMWYLLCIQGWEHWRCHMGRALPYKRQNRPPNRWTKKRQAKRTFCEWSAVSQDSSHCSTLQDQVQCENRWCKRITCGTKVKLVLPCGLPWSTPIVFWVPYLEPWMWLSKTESHFERCPPQVCDWAEDSDIQVSWKRPTHTCGVIQRIVWQREGTEARRQTCSSRLRCSYPGCSLSCQALTGEVLGQRFLFMGFSQVKLSRSIRAGKKHWWSCSAWPLSTQVFNWFFSLVHSSILAFLLRISHTR